jgi:hypothetical protein
VFASPHLRTATDPVSETLSLLVFRNPEDEQIQKTSGTSMLLFLM